MKAFYAPGKVMLCGEYTVTIGQEALALPTQLGQWMRVWEFEMKDEWKLVWQSQDIDGQAWWNMSFSLEQFLVDSDTVFEEFADDAIALNLLKMLQQLPMKTWTPGKSVRIETHLQFPQEWGLGSSSTLCALLARWSLGDAQKIQQAVWGGSGYDVAVAEVGKPLVYWISGDEPNWAEWRLRPELSANWWILMPGNKQNSRESLRSVKERLLELQQEPFIMHQLKQIIDRIKLAEDVPTMEAGLEMYQAILGTMLEVDTPYQKMGWQPVRGGLCKWLGAWGGDMILVNENYLNHLGDEVKEWRKVRWNDLVINS